MALPDIDIAIERALRSAEIRADGFSHKGPSLDSLIRFKRFCDADDFPEKRVRPVLYQRFISSSSGDR
jgi:hypothetical protein